MRFITVSCFIAMLLLVCFSPFKAAATQYVRITESFVNVYEYLDPKSTVIKMATKGDHLELIYPGPSWYQVKIRDKTGWVERKAGEVVDQGGLFSPLLSIILILFAVAGTIVGILWYVKKQKPVEI